MLDEDRWLATRANAIWSLSRIGDGAYTDALIRIAAEDESETVRVAAMRTLAVLAGDPDGLSSGDPFTFVDFGVLALAPGGTDTQFYWGQARCPYF